MLTKPPSGCVSALWPPFFRPIRPALSILFSSHTVARILPRCAGTALSSLQGLFFPPTCATFTAFSFSLRRPAALPRWPPLFVVNTMRHVVHMLLGQICFRLPIPLMPLPSPYESAIIAICFAPGGLMVSCTFLLCRSCNVRRNCLAVPRIVIVHAALLTSACFFSCSLPGLFPPRSPRSPPTWLYSWGSARCRCHPPRPITAARHAPPSSACPSLPFPAQRHWACCSAWPVLSAPCPAPAPVPRPLAHRRPCAPLCLFQRT